MQTNKKCGLYTTSSFFTTFFLQSINKNGGREGIEIILRCLHIKKIKIHIIIKIKGNIKDNSLDKNYSIFQTTRFSHIMIFFKLTD